MRFVFRTIIYLFIIIISIKTEYKRGVYCGCRQMLNELWFVLCFGFLLNISLHFIFQNKKVTKDSYLQYCTALCIQSNL